MDRSRPIRPPSWGTIVTVFFIASVCFYCFLELRSGPLGCAPHPSHVLAKYTDLAYPLRTPDLAVDVIISVYSGVERQFSGIVLCHRRRPPQKVCIPGGYVEYGESVEGAAVREVLEETGLNLEDNQTEMRQFHVFSNPLRDRRRHTVSVAFDVSVFDQVPRASDDVRDCNVMAVDKLLRLPPVDFAFDHYDVLHQFLAAKRLK